MAWEAVPTGKRGRQRNFRSDGPLHLLFDSTGIKVEGEGEWNARKHGGTKRRVWRKIHIGIDEKSPETRGPSSPPARSAMHPCCPRC